MILALQTCVVISYIKQSDGLVPRKSDIGLSSAQIMKAVQLSYRMATFKYDESIANFCKFFSMPEGELVQIMKENFGKLSLMCEIFHFCDLYAEGRDV
jgi:hypothetical protein